MTELSIDWRGRREVLLLVAFLLLVIGAGALIGVLAAPDEWYAGLEKPPFNPPGWVFAPVWFVLYVLIAVAGWRTFLREPTGAAMWLWCGQMALNWLWSPVFFVLQHPWPALAVISLLLVLIVAFMRLSARRADRVSAWLFAPYLAWVTFASALNLSIAYLN